MKLRERFYGKNPSPRQKWMHNFSYLGLILFAIGAYLDFVPSETWYSFGLKIAFIAGSTATGFIWWAYFTKRVTPRVKLNAFFIALFYLLIPVISVLFIHVSFTHAIGGLYSAFLGDHKYVIISVHKSKQSSRRFCDFRLEGDSINRAFPAHLCISEAAFDRLPDEFELKLYVKQSYTGSLIDTFDLYKR